MTKPHLCPRCAADPQPANFGEPRNCAFHPDGKYTEDNWNCATMNILRGHASSTETDHRHGDESVAVVLCPDAWNSEPTHLVLCFYKWRGRTASAYEMDEENQLRPLTFEVADRVANDIASLAAKPVEPHADDVIVPPSIPTPAGQRLLAVLAANKAAAEDDDEPVTSQASDKHAPGMVQFRPEAVGGDVVKQAIHDGTTELLRNIERERFGLPRAVDLVDGLRVRPIETLDPPADGVVHLPVVEEPAPLTVRYLGTTQRAAFPVQLLEDDEGDPK